jgi:hypothetical protein
MDEVMKIIVLGSSALNHHFKVRSPKDLDVVIHFDDLEEFKAKYNLVRLFPKNPNKFHGIDRKRKHYEIEVAGVQEESSASLLYELSDTFDYKSEILVPPLELLYHIKMSHRFKFGPHFEKTRNDIFLMRNNIKSDVPKDEWRSFLKKRKEEAYKKTPKLKGITKGQFFFDHYGDVFQLVHDTIHLTQAIDDAPAYTKFQVGEVECCMKKFFEVDEQVRLNAVFEESATLAVERSIWPSQFTSDEYLAFKGSLQRLCCHISSGKFRTYCWENYDKVLAMFESNVIINRFKDGFNKGIVQFQNVNQM